MEDNRTVAIIGCGLVGQSWAIVFSTAKVRVRIYDNKIERLQAGMSSIRTKMDELEAKGCLRGTIQSNEAFTYIEATNSLEQCVKEANYVQECVFEDFDLKRNVFKEVEKYVLDDVILASSSGSIYASRLSDGLCMRDRIIVAHPLNPPHLVPLVEIIPAPWTDPAVVTGTRRLLQDVGQQPIVAKKETAGFIICRIQHTITSECFKLIKDDVISVTDLDKLMPYGLGLRYAFLGALETCHLNADGIEQFCELYKEPIYEIQKQSGPPIKFEGEDLVKVQKELEQQVPLGEIEKRRQWRDDNSAQLWKLKN